MIPISDFKKWPRMLTLWWVVPASLLWMGCSNDDESPNSHTPLPPPVVDATLAAKANAMGYDVFRQLTTDYPGSNVIISPWSLQSALLMAAEGGAGTSRSELLDLLYLDEASLGELRSDYLPMRATLAEPAGHPTVQSANAFFYDDQRLLLHAPYSELLTTHYLAETHVMDFGHSAAPDQINQWVSDRTEGLIPEILEEIPAAQLFYLINALYFSADWMHGFAEESTQEAGSFTRTDGSEVTTPLMWDTRTVHTSVANGLRMVDLPMRDSTYSMALIQPVAFEAGNQAWLDGATPQGLMALHDALEEAYVTLIVPRMELKFSEDIIPQLQAIGAVAPFAPSLSDFSQISPQQGPQIVLDPVLHEVVLSADEKGVEGAAVTVVGGVLTSSPPVLDFSRPLVLSLRHIPTGMQLFLGYVDQPMP